MSKRTSSPTSRADSDVSPFLLMSLVDVTLSVLAPALVVILTRTRRLRVTVPELFGPPL